MILHLVIICAATSFITATWVAFIVGTIAAQRQSKLDEIVLKDMAKEYERISIEVMTQKINQISKKEVQSHGMDRRD